MLRTRRYFASAAVTALAAIGLAACGSGGGSQALSAASGCKSVTNIRIATTPYQDSLIMTLGQKLGWYKRACLNVSFTNVAFTDEMSTLASGTVDVAWYNTTGVVSTYHLDPKLVYLYPWDIFDQGAAMMVRPGTGLKTYAQLRSQGMSNDQAIRAVITELHGKTVVTTLGEDTGEDLIMALRRQGKPLSWVHVINLSQDSGLATFLRGTGDAYIGGIPQRQTLVEHHYSTLIAGPALTAAPLNGFVTTRSYWQQNQQALLALMHVTFMAIRYTDAHTQQVASYVSKLYDQQTGATLTPADFVSFWQKLEHYPADAGQAQSDLLSPTGYAYWGKIWAQDNDYLHTVTKAIPAAVPESAFLGDTFQKLYVAKYGASESGWWPVSGNLG